MDPISNAPAPLRYVPIGTRYTRDELNNLGLMDLTNRDIRDPRYAGFDPDFNWRDYVTVNIRSPEFRAEVEASFDQLAQTPEGQHLMRQALAMQVFRNTGAVITPPFDPADYQGHRIDIRNREGPSQFLPHTGTVQLNRAQMRQYEYLGSDGSYHDLRIQHLLVHEMAHAADGLLISLDIFTELGATHGRPVTQAIEQFFRPYSDGRFPSDAAIDTFFESIGPQRALYFSGPVEFPSIRFTNEVMERYYGETPRVLDHDLRTGARVDPRREGLFFYSDIQLAPSIQYAPAPSDDIVAPRTPEQPVASRTYGPEI